MAPYSKTSTTLSHLGHHQTTSRWESNGLPSLLQEQKQRVDQASNTFLPPPLLSSKAPIIKPWRTKRVRNDEGNDTSAYSFFRHLNRNLVKKAPASVPSTSSDRDSRGSDSSGSDSGSESESGSDESGGSDSNNDSDGSGTEDGSDGDDDDDDDDDDSSGIEDESGVDSDEGGENKQHDSRHSQESIDFRFLNTKKASPQRQRPQNKRPALLPWETSIAGEPPAAITLPLPLPPKPPKAIEALKPVPAKPPESMQIVEFPWMVEPKLTASPNPIQPKPFEPNKIEVPPKPVEPETPTTQSQYVPSKMARSKMEARPNLDDEAAFFKGIESRYLSKLGIDTTSSKPAQTPKPQPRPPPPSQKSIQEASCRSWELLQKKNAKRLLNQSRAEIESKTAKRVKLGEANAPPPTKLSAQTVQTTTATAAAKAKIKALPIESDRTIIQYTVFETQRLPLPFDGQLRDKVLRRESFLDKHKANVFAARLMPKAEYVQSSAAIIRIESDYGKDDAERDGMFFGRVYYRKDGRDEIKFVYVDREKQQLGKMSVSDLEKEVSSRDLSTEYIDPFLAVRYDVFVVLRKVIQPDDGRFVVYKYDESEVKIRTREDVDVDSDEEEEEEQAKETDEVDGVKESRDDDEEEMEAGQAEEADEEEEEVECAESTTEISEPREQSQQSSLGSHFEHLLQGSYTTLLEANSKAIDAFEKWTRPPSDRPRLDSIIYYRDYIKPDLAQRRAAFDADDGSENAEANKRDVESIELSWEPLPQFGYSYSSVSVVVTKSQMQGPLDLTGAFKGR